MSDTQTLFEAIEIGSAFNRIKHGAVDYSRRAAERRQSKRTVAAMPAVVRLNDADICVETVNLSSDGILVDRLIPRDVREHVVLTIDGLGDIDCEVVKHESGQTGLRLLKSEKDNEALEKWRRHVDQIPARPNSPAPSKP
jgi:hypothetical protein